MRDLIDRQAAIDALENFWKGIGDRHKTLDGEMAVYGDCKRIIKNLPSAQPDLDEWCTDCKEYDQERHCCPRFSRVIKTTVEEMKQAAQTEITLEQAIGRLRDLGWMQEHDRILTEYAQSERKTGHWIEDGYSHYKAVCDQCGEPCGTYAAGKPRDRFCKWCGADMRGEQDNIPMEYFESGGR